MKATVEELMEAGFPERDARAIECFGYKEYARIKYGSPERLGAFVGLIKEFERIIADEKEKKS